MSSFTELVVSECGKDKEGRQLYKLDRPFTYAIGRKGAGAVVAVPQGMITDFESIPKLFSGVIKEQPKYRAAFVVHDWLCRTSTPWHMGVYIMVDALKTLGCPWWRRNLIYGLPVLLWGLVRKVKR